VKAHETARPALPGDERRTRRQLVQRRITGPVGVALVAAGVGVVHRAGGLADPSTEPGSARHGERPDRATS
jgi:hypothetical protein